MQPHSLSGRTVCIVDDDDLVRRMITLNLRGHGIVVRDVASGDELFDVMAQEHLDCILMDYDLAAENGLAVHDRLRQHFLDVPPVIMLTGSDNQRTIIKAFRTGMDDYLLKSSLRTEELLQSVGSAIGRRAEDDARRAELERLKRQTDVDDLTGVYRRGALETMLGRLVETSARAGKPFAVVSFRMNELDVVQLRAGQVVARRALGSFATRLRKALRAGDLCGLGRDNTFVCLVDQAPSRRDAERLAAAWAEALRFAVQAEALSFAVTADTGIAMFPADAQTPDALLAEAFARLGTPPHGPAGDTPPGQPASEAAPTERRAHVRQRVFKGGQIITNGGNSVLDCTVRDLSQGGARLRLQTSFTPPALFDLHILGTGRHHRARLAWQKGTEIGVAFVP